MHFIQILALKSKLSAWNIPYAAHTIKEALNIP